MSFHSGRSDKGGARINYLRSALSRSRERGKKEDKREGERIEYLREKGSMERGPRQQFVWRQSLVLRGTNKVILDQGKWLS